MAIKSNDLTGVCLCVSGRYESFAGLPEDECGILQGCENGRCVRVGEGYTCDCYDGYELDIASMTCLGNTVLIYIRTVGCVAISCYDC